MFWHRRLVRWTRLCGCGRCVREGHDLEDANVLSRVQEERLRPVIVDGNPKLWATRERRDASHKRW